MRRVRLTIALATGVGLALAGPPARARATSPSAAAEPDSEVPDAPSETAPSSAPENTTPSPTPADEAAALVGEADAAFQQERYPEAWDALERAEALRPGPFYDYMRGLIRQAQGRCDLAVEYWARYLESDPSRQDADDVERLIEECGGLPREGSTPEAAVEPVAPDPGTEPRRDVDIPRPWHRDLAGGVLLGTGLASLAATGGLLVATAVDRRRAPDSESLMLHDSRIRRGRGQSYAAIATGVVGGALIVGAIVRYLMVARRAPPGMPARRQLDPALSWRF